MESIRTVWRVSGGLRFPGGGPGDCARERQARPVSCWVRAARRGSFVSDDAGARNTYPRSVLSRTGLDCALTSKSIAEIVMLGRLCQ